MNELARTPELIATEINTIKDQTRKIMLSNSIEIGRRLTEAKELVPHGEWGAWLEKSVDYSKSTANNLMRIFEEYGSEQITLLEDNAKSEVYAKLSYSQAVALLGIPEEEREAFIAENDVESMSTRKLQKEIDSLKEKLENAKKTAIEKCNEVTALIDEKNKAESSARDFERIFRESQSDVKMLQDTLKVERERRELEIQKLENEIKTAQASGNDEEIEAMQESMKTLDDELAEVRRKNAELEKQLKEIPIEVPQVIEKIPEELTKELEELRKKAGTVDKAVDKFKANFEIVKTGFNGLLETLNEIQEKEKYKAATVKYLNILLEKMKDT